MHSRIYVYDISKSDLVMSTLIKFFFFYQLPAALYVCLSDLYIYVAVWLHFSVASQLAAA